MLELGRQVAEEAEQPEVRERRRDREVQEPGQLLQRAELGEHRHRLLRPDHRDRHDRDLRAHRRLDEAAAPEAPQPVAVLVELLGPLAALGEHEHELALVVEQALDVGRVGRDAADLRHQHREQRVALEEVLDGQVHGPRARVLLLDRLEDHRRVGRERARVVGDEQRAAVGRDVLDPLDLAAEPVVVEELVDRLVEQPLDALRAAPVGDLAVGLDRRQVVAQVGAGGRQLLHGASTGSSSRASSSQSSPQTTSSVSHSSRFQGCRIVATVIPASIARRRFSGESSISRSMPISSQRVTLS